MGATSLVEEATSRENAMAAELAAKSAVMLPRLFDTLATRRVVAENGSDPKPLTL